MAFKKIVAATDFSEPSLIAVQTAFSLTLENNATLYLVHVVTFPTVADPMVDMLQPWGDEFYQEQLERLQALIPESRRKDVTIEKVILTGTPAKVIADFALEKEVDLIVVGTHGRKGLTRVLMGSTAESLLREAPCQVLVVKQRAKNEGVRSETTKEQATLSS